MPCCELSAENAALYLRQSGRIPSEDVRCRELGGGVSNTVLLVESGRERFVVKQALPRLRVREEWLAGRARIFRERDALIDAVRLLPPGWVPRVLWSDDANFAYAMEAFAGGAESWKNRLLRGRIETRWAVRAGMALGLTIRGTWRSAEFAARYASQTAFGQLRTDPYYRTIAARHPGIRTQAEEWIAETAEKRIALVHGDWSPKNMILADGRMIFIDYECAHFGDPSYDLAFVTNHLLLKAFHQPELATKFSELASIALAWTLAVLPADALRGFEQGAARHLAFLLLARVDGKSPVEYLSSEERRETVRRAAKRLIAQRPRTIAESFALALGS